MSENSSWSWVDVVCLTEQAAPLQTMLFALGAAGTEERFRNGEAPEPRQVWDTGPANPLPAHRVIRAWFESATPVSLKAHLAQPLIKMGHPFSSTYYGTEESTDYQAQFRAQHPTVRVSNRLVISPPWRANPGDLIIEPGIGFGTGSHATTHLALLALDKVADSVETVLDVGCGSGILALAAAKLGLQACGFDIETAAVENAKRHATQNGLAVDFSTRPIENWTGPFDLVLANLHAELLCSLYTDLVRLTGHTLIASGILTEKTEQVLASLSPHFEVVEQQSADGWTCLIFSHPMSRP